MKKKRLLMGGLCLGLTFGVCADNTNDEVHKAIRAAKEAQKKAVAVQGGWISTPKLIKKAEAAATKGDRAKALELAVKAKKDAELGYAQAIYEREHWSPPPYLR